MQIAMKFGLAGLITCLLVDQGIPSTAPDGTKHHFRSVVSGRGEVALVVDIRTDPYAEFPALRFNHRQALPGLEPLLLVGVRQPELVVRGAIAGWIDHHRAVS